MYFIYLYLSTNLYIQYIYIYTVAVSEPKMLPKMTLLDVPPFLPDGEIISGILDKNPQIEELL